ncbi:MAG: peptidoglycan editing factor PgeF [Gammaproteobacteria bacterium]|nr:peptidoglycan editing factor PgeF [Gammaproteobacteria bacterium]
MIPIIKPHWPAPKNVCAFSTTRKGGISTGVYESLNLSSYVGDNLENVLQNQKILADQCSKWNRCQTRERLAPFVWLEQQHETLVVNAANPQTLFADGSYTQQKNIVCSVLTADCLPVLLCNKEGTEIAAIHAGWRGLLKGVIESGVAKFKDAPENILAWLGPAIGSEKFEVGNEVREAFIKHNPQAESCFKQNRPNHFLANIYDLARQRLRELSITQIYGGEFCTYGDPQKFFSYRRDGQCGRMANLIWLNS